MYCENCGSVIEVRTGYCVGCFPDKEELSELRAQNDALRRNIEASTARLNESLYQQSRLQAEADSMRKIYTLAVAYREAQKITHGRVHSEDFWATAGADDVDEIDLEETLAQSRLFDAIDSAMKGQ